MALNPFFIHGSQGEQNLIQDLINEQLRMYGVEVIYIPRKFVNKKTIIAEVQSSKFDDNFAIEAYLNNFDGPTGNGDIMTKFGITVKDEISLTISKERYDDFIKPFMEDMDDYEVPLYGTPREGDLIYFPYGKKLFEVKYVEFEKPFYQLQKVFTFELTCELFEYEDEVLDTGISDIDLNIQEQGYIATINIVGSGVTATGTATTTTGYVQRVILVNDGHGYTSTPLVTFTSPPVGFTTATAVAITTQRGLLYSVEEIRITNAGYGYTQIPKVYITGGNGAGAIATCLFTVGSATSFGVGKINIGAAGTNYAVAPTVTVSSPPGAGVTAIARAQIDANGSVTSVYMLDAGSGYTSAPTITFSNPPVNGSGSYEFNEIVTGQDSGVTGRVREWNSSTNTLKVGIVTGAFYRNEQIVGSDSNATYTIRKFVSDNLWDPYAQNDEIELEADSILDFSESNPFGNY